MNLKSPSFAKTLILLSLVIASISGWYGHRLMGTNATATSRIQSLEKDARALRASWAEMSEVLHESDAEPMAVGEALAQLRLRLEHLQVAHGVTLAQTTLSNRAGGDAVPVSKLAQTVKDTPVKTLRVDVRGMYTDYEGLLAYLQEVRSGVSVAVVALDVRANQFEVSLRVYGV